MVILNLRKFLTLGNSIENFAELRLKHGLPPAQEKYLYINLYLSQQSFNEIVRQKLNQKHINHNPIIGYQHANHLYNLKY